MTTWDYYTFPPVDPPKVHNVAVSRHKGVGVLMQHLTTLRSDNSCISVVVTVLN